MKILILSTSPRKSFSTSLYLGKILKFFLAGNSVEIFQLKSVGDYTKIIGKLSGIDALVFTTPVYVDSIPSTTLEHLKKLEEFIGGKNYNFKVYSILNCGFYEGHQCCNALKTYELWCKKAGLDFGGGIGVGSGVMIGFVRVLPFVGVAISIIEILVHLILLCLNNSFSMDNLFMNYFPFNFVIQTVIYILFTMGVFVNILKLKNSIINRIEHVIKYTTVWFCPRFLFVALASIYWFGRALLWHGIAPWKILKKG